MIIEIIIGLVSQYALAGLLFAIPFVIKGASCVDEGAKEATWGFRLIIIPGTVIWWPLLLKKWIQSAKKSKP